MLTTSNHTHEEELPPEKPQLLSVLHEQGLDVKLALLQHHARLAELLAREIMEDEVFSLASRRHAQDKPYGGRYSRWGSNPGSIQIGDERVPFRVPRLRDTKAGKERPLESYQA